MRDPVRLAFAFLGSALLMTVFCFGISLDVEDLRFAALDQDRTPESRAYIAAFEGSRYFAEGPASPRPRRRRAACVAGEARWRSRSRPASAARFAPVTGREVSAVVDGAVPYKRRDGGGLRLRHPRGAIWPSWRARRAGDSAARADRDALPLQPGFESLNAMAPGHAGAAPDPAAGDPDRGSRGARARARHHRQLPCHAGHAARVPGGQAGCPISRSPSSNFLLLSAMTAALFGVPLKGNALALALGALLYVWATTAFGLVVATLDVEPGRGGVRDSAQHADPRRSSSPACSSRSRPSTAAARAIGSVWPASYFLHLSVGAFAKGLGWAGLWLDIAALAALRAGPHADRRRRAARAGALSCGARAGSSGSG